MTLGGERVTEELDAPSYFARRLAELATVASYDQASPPVRMPALLRACLDTLAQGIIEVCPHDGAAARELLDAAHEALETGTIAAFVARQSVH